MAERRSTLVRVVWLASARTGYRGGVTVTALDHIALWVDDRTALAAFLCDIAGLREIERTERFTLIGGDPREGKLTLIAAPGPRQHGVLDRIVLRVPDVAACLGRIALRPDRPAAGPLGADEVGAPAGVPLALVLGAPESLPDLDHVVLRVTDPAAVAEALAGLGLELDGDRLRVGTRHVLLREGAPDTGEPLLNHLAFLVDSADTARAETVELGFVVDRVVDAPNTLAVFLRGPEQLSIELVEHKPSVSLV